MSVQNDYRISQQIGVVGAPARPGQSFGEELFIAGVEAPQPGEAFIIGNSGQALRPTNQTEAGLAIGVVSFSQGDINSPITRTVNHDTGVVYVEDDEFPCMLDGHIYVQAGNLLVKGDTVIFDSSTGKWIGGVTTKSSFIAQTAGGNADIIAIQITRIG